jgi:hypothetical protein
MLLKLHFQNQISDMFFFFAHRLHVHLGSSDVFTCPFCADENALNILRFVCAASLQVFERDLHIFYRTTAGVSNAGGSNAVNSLWLTGEFSSPKRREIPASTPSKRRPQRVATMSASSRPAGSAGDELSLKFLFANHDGVHVVLRFPKATPVPEVKAQLLRHWPDGTPAGGAPNWAAAAELTHLC